MTTSQRSQAKEAAELSDFAEVDAERAIGTFSRVWTQATADGIDVSARCLQHRHVKIAASIRKFDRLGLPIYFRS